MNLEEIKQRESKATKGEWKIYNEDFGKAIGTVEHHPQLQAPTPIVTLGLGKGGHKIHINENNADFIAHARQDIPDLIAEVENLKERLKIEEELFENSNETLGHAQEENVRLREALAFYADPKTHEQICSEEPPKVWVDEGRIARQALGW